VNTFLSSYLQQHLRPNIKHIVIFMDNSAGQNKNRYFFSLCQNLVNTSCDSVKVYFPIPGHSFMPIARDFAVLEKNKKRSIELSSHQNWLQF